MKKQGKLSLNYSCYSFLSLGNDTLLIGFSAEHKEVLGKQIGLITKEIQYIYLCDFFFSDIFISG